MVINRFVHRLLPEHVQPLALHCFRSGKIAVDGIVSILTNVR
jgi:hypothetical protein